MYVRLKHALSTLALEAVRSPKRGAPRTAVAWLVAFCDLCRGERFVLPHGAIATRLRRRRPGLRGGGRTEVQLGTAWHRIVRLGLLNEENGAASLPEPFRPHFPYMNRQGHRAAAVLRALETSSRGQRLRGKAAAVWRGVALFNGGLFFECHEYLEDLWRAAPPEERSFYQGIILIAAGFYHYEKGNLHGARTKLAAGIEKLKPYLPASHGVRLDRWMASLAPWLARIDAGATGVLDTSEIPKIALAFKRAS